MGSRIEDLVTALLNGETVDLNPTCRTETYLKRCIDGTGTEGLPNPISRLDILLYQLAAKMSGTYDGTGDAQTYLLCTPDGQEIPAVLVEEETVFTATANDIRQGTVAATDEGVTVGTKVIPSYNTAEGFKIIPKGSSFTISTKYYEYTKLQVIICDFNTSLSDSVAAEKVVMDDNVYDVLSTDSIAVVEIDHDNARIDLGITNDSDSLKLIKYFTYKEIY